MPPFATKFPVVILTFPMILALPCRNRFPPEILFVELRLPAVAVPATSNATRLPTLVMFG